MISPLPRFPSSVILTPTGMTLLCEYKYPNPLFKVLQWVPWSCQIKPKGIKRSSKVPYNSVPHSNLTTYFPCVVHSTRPTLDFSSLNIPPQCVHTGHSSVRDSVIHKTYCLSSLESLIKRQGSSWVFPGLFKTACVLSSMLPTIFFALFFSVSLTI